MRMFAVGVRIGALPAGVEVDVVDDGAGIDALAQAGLGYRLFGAATAEEWTIDNRTSGGAHLRLTIPT